MEINTFIEQELEKRMLASDVCKNCVFFHENNGLVDPKIKCYCFFAYDCLIGHKRRFMPNNQFITAENRNCANCKNNCHYPSEIPCSECGINFEKWEAKNDVESNN